MTSSCGELQLNERRPSHSVKLYGADHSGLVRDVTSFVRDGLKAEQTNILIAIAPHREALYREISSRGISPQHTLKDERLLFVDAHQTLARILSGGRIDKTTFSNVTRGLLGEAGAQEHGVRIYGEMVGLLWQDGNYEAAVELERLWNELLRWKPFDLLCSYPIDIFDRGFNTKMIDEVLCSHHHLLSSGNDAELLDALEFAMDDILDGRADHLRPLIKANHRPAWGTVPAAESLILWLRNNLPGHAEIIISRAKSLYGKDGSA